MDWKGFVPQWVEACRKDEELRENGTYANFSFCLRADDFSVLLTVNDGRIEHWQLHPSLNETWDFSLVGTDEVWTRFLSPVPPSPYHGIFAMLARVPEFRVEGNRLVFMRYVYIVRRMLDIARAVAGGKQPATEDSAIPLKPGVEPITGRYVNIAVDGVWHRIYYEESGTGRDLLFLHTAGADSRQFYGLMTTEELLQDWHMVAFDLPLHGKSFPPAGYVPGSYRLTTDAYVKTICAVVEALGLKRPVVLGSSMAGEICLELAYRHPEKFSAVIACEASDHIEGRLIEWARHPEVNETLFVPEWIEGLMAPTTPAKQRQEILWGYAQCGHGVFYGDITFYSREWDARDRVKDIDTTRCPVYMLTGEYDYSCTTEHSKKTAEKIPGAKFQIMKGLGHFPMAENPNLFMEYIRPILKEIASKSA